MRTFNNPIQELEYLRKKLCCLEDCMTATLISEDDFPVNDLGLGDSYLVTITVGGIDIISTFENEETAVDILAALNLKFLDFKIVFTVDTNDKLVATITNNKAACDVTMDAVLTLAP